MADEEKPAENDAETAEKPPLYINGQYIKDLSFEVPHAPHIFTTLREAPEIDVNVDINAARLNEQNAFNVDLKFRVEGKAGEQVAFIAELVYSAAVTLNVEKEHIEPMLLIEVPRHLFPFARAILADLVRDGGFPPMMISPIDFVALYKERMTEKKESAPAEKS